MESLEIQSRKNVCQYSATKQHWDNLQAKQQEPTPFSDLKYLHHQEGSERLFRVDTQVLGLGWCEAAPPCSARSPCQFFSHHGGWTYPQRRTLPNQVRRSPATHDLVERV